jgi:hypothetical protein
MVLIVLSIPLCLWHALDSPRHVETAYREQQARLTYDFYSSLGENTDLFSVDNRTPVQYEEGGLKYYGGFFSLLTSVSAKLTGTYQNPEAFFFWRQAWLAVFAFLLLLFASRLAAEMGNWQTAVMTLLFLWLSPRFTGHLWLSTTDAPFFAAFTAAVYFAIQCIRLFPRIQPYPLAGWTLSLTIALGTHVYAWMLVMLFGVFLVVRYFQFVSEKRFVFF